MTVQVMHREASTVSDKAAAFAVRFARCVWDRCFSLSPVLTADLIQKMLRFYLGLQAQAHPAQLEYDYRRAYRGRLHPQRETMAFCKTLSGFVIHPLIPRTSVSSF